MRGDASRQDRSRTIEHSPAALPWEAIGGTASRNLYVHRDERRREAAEEEVGEMRAEGAGGRVGRGRPRNAHIPHRIGPSNTAFPRANVRRKTPLCKRSLIC
jgi:hypothetical protein